MGGTHVKFDVLARTEFAFPFYPRDNRFLVPTFPLVKKREYEIMCNKKPRTRNLRKLKVRCTGCKIDVNRIHKQPTLAEFYQCKAPRDFLLRIFYGEREHLGIHVSYADIVDHIFRWIHSDKMIWMRNVTLFYGKGFFRKVIS